MKKRERIAELERKVADLTVRLVSLEARPYQTWTLPANPPVTIPSIYPTAPTITWGGNTCGVNQ